MSSHSLPPCRLNVMLARDAPLGVIFRRGPSEWTQVIRWNTDDDSFEYGSWLRGKIFFERSDISTDGGKLLYFATKYTNRDLDFPTAYTALSRLPWLTALCAWPNGDTHYGGGLFENDNKIWVNQATWPHGPLAENAALPPNFEVDYENALWDPNYHGLLRLERSGWKPIERYPWGSIPARRVQSDGTWAWGPTDPDCPIHTPAFIRTIHEKNSASGEFSLVLTSIFEHLKPNSQTFAWRNNHSKKSILLENVSWADWDKKGRLLYAKAGELFSVDTGYPHEIRAQALANFNGLRPKQTKSPVWARTW